MHWIKNTTIFSILLLLVLTISGCTFFDMFGYNQLERLTGSGPSSLDTGLVSYWNFDTNNTFNDYKGLNNGTIVNATYTNSGKLGGAYIFNGNASASSTQDYITFSNSQSLNITDNIGISIWIKPNLVTSGEQIIISKNTYQQYKIGYVSSGKFRWTLTNSTSNTIDVESILTYTNTSKWYHIVGTYDGSMARLYVDNVLVKNSSFQGNLRSSTQGAAIGCFSAASRDRCFNGSIDEVGIWNRNLSTTDISDLYNNGTGVTIPFTSCITLTNGIVLTTNSTVCTGTYNLSSGISLIGNNLVLSCDGSTLEGDYVTHSTSGIHVQGNNSIIKDCTIKGYAVGISADNYFASPANSVYSNLMIVNNTLIKMGGLASIFTDGYSSINISNNFCYNNTDYFERSIGAHCIYLSGDSQSDTIVSGTISNNIITNMSASGIKLNSVGTARNILIYGNTISALTPTQGDDIGIHLADTTNISVYNNTCIGPFDTCVVLNIGSNTSRFANNNNIYGNTFTNTVNGLWIKNYTYSNIITNNSYTGNDEAIRFDSKANFTVFEDQNMTLGYKYGSYLLKLNGTGLKNFSITENNFTMFNGRSQWRPYNQVFNSTSSTVISLDPDSISVLLSPNYLITTMLSTCLLINSSSAPTISSSVTLCNANVIGANVTLGASNIVVDCNGFTNTALVTGSGNAFIQQDSGKSNVTIKNCNLNNWARGIWDNNADNWIMEYNNITGGTEGINMQGNASGSVARYNNIRNTSNSGIILTGDDTKAYGNTLANSSTNCIKISTGFYRQNATNNTCLDTLGFGIDMTGGTVNNVIIVGNTLKDKDRNWSIMNDKHGIGNGGNPTTGVISGNYIEGFDTGISLGHQANTKMSITGNTVNHTQGWGIWINSNGTNITGNFMYNCGWNCIISNGWGNYIGYNFIDSYYHHGIDMHQSVGDDATNNTIGGNTIIEYNNITYTEPYVCRYYENGTYDCGTGAMSLLIDNTNNVTTRYNRVYNNNRAIVGGSAGRCIAVEGGNYSYDNLIYGNTCTNFTGTALQLDAKNATFFNNTWSQSTDTQYSIYVTGAFDFANDITTGYFYNNTDLDKTLTFRIYLNNRTNISISENKKYIIKVDNSAGRGAYINLIAQSPFNDLVNNSNNASISQDFTSYYSFFGPGLTYRVDNMVSACQDQAITLNLTQNATYNTDCYNIQLYFINTGYVKINSTLEITNDLNLSTGQIAYMLANGRIILR